MTEFYKYFYAGASPSAPLTIIKKISQKWESQPNVSRCPANFTPVNLLGNGFSRVGTKFYHRMKPIKMPYSRKISCVTGGNLELLNK